MAHGNAQMIRTVKVQGRPEPVQRCNADLFRRSKKMLDVTESEQSEAGHDQDHYIFLRDRISSCMRRLRRSKNEKTAQYVRNTEIELAGTGQWMC